MSYSAIGTQIKTILLTISDFNIIYGYEPKELLKYPSATVTASSHADSFSSTAKNLRTFKFDIRLYFRTDTAEDAEGILRDLADQEREVPVRVVEIVIECLERLPR
jgi:hypothetical protein